MNAVLAPALASILSLAPAAHADEEAIAALLDRMEAAVLAADADAYLAFVDTTEPEWATEQLNWGADLAEHAPEAFGLELRSPLEPAEGEALLGDLAVEWRLSGGPSRRVEFPARFVRGPQGWLFAGEAWQRLASDDGQSIVLFLDDALHPVAERIVEVMPGIREHVDEGFETSLDHPQVIKLYDDMGHLQQSIYLSYAEPLGGWNEPGESIKLLADPDMSTRRLSIVLSHEYGHVATFSFDPDAGKHLPWWVAEGFSELAAERYSGPGSVRGVREMVRGWAKSGTLAAWDDMADFRQTPPRLHPNVYLQGHHFAGYVSERFGRTARNHWLRLLAGGRSLDEASRDALGIGFSALDADWRASLQPEAEQSDER